jgi:hypothetical protein
VQVVVPCAEVCVFPGLGSKQCLSALAAQKCMQWYMCCVSDLEKKWSPGPKKSCMNKCSAELVALALQNMCSSCSCHRKTPMHWFVALCAP